MPLYSQPDYINFQSVIRDGNSKLITNKAVSIRVTLLRNSAVGSIIYREHHSITTNINGIATLQIGSGISDMGVYQDVD
jgi:hypothetical protein